MKKIKLFGVFLFSFTLAACGGSSSEEGGSGGGVSGVETPSKVVIIKP